MNTLGLSMLFKMGCLCTKDDITINNCKYYVLEELAQGGFSTVLLVENARTRKRFAVKKIVCHSRDDQKMALQEVEYHKRLDHPNIINCLESCVSGCADPVLNTTSEVLLLLPYYSRGTLAYLLEMRGRTRHYLEESEVLRVFLQICDGVKAFHDSQPTPLAHRDIKPANILLDVDNTPIIMDLGSVAPAVVQVRGAPEALRLQDEAAERCSMPYRAPELFNVESYCVVDQRTDIWVVPTLKPAITGSDEIISLLNKSVFGFVFLVGAGRHLNFHDFPPRDHDFLAIIGNDDYSRRRSQNFQTNIESWIPQSLGCLLYAMCYFKSPFDAVYERGDSVALAVISPTIDYPAVTPFSQDTHQLIDSMLKVSPMERPYIYTVIEKAQDVRQKLGGVL